MTGANCFQPKAPSRLLTAQDCSVGEKAVGRRMRVCFYFKLFFPGGLNLFPLSFLPFFHLWCLSLLILSFFLFLSLATKIWAVGRGAAALSSEEAQSPKGKGRWRSKKAATSLDTRTEREKKSKRQFYLAWNDLAFSCPLLPILIHTEFCVEEQYSSGGQQFPLWRNKEICYLWCSQNSILTWLRIQICLVRHNHITTNTTFSLGSSSLIISYLLKYNVP